MMETHEMYGFAQSISFQTLASNHQESDHTLGKRPHPSPWAGRPTSRPSPEGEDGEALAGLKGNSSTCLTLWVTRPRTAPTPRPPNSTTGSGIQVTSDDRPRTAPPAPPQKNITTGVNTLDLEMQTSPAFNWIHIVSLHFPTRKAQQNTDDPGSRAIWAWGGSVCGLLFHSAPKQIASKN